MISILSAKLNTVIKARKMKVYFLETFLGIWFDKIIQTNGNFCVWFSDFKV